MPTTRFQRKATIVLGCAALILILLPACSINVKKEKDGDDKQVDIKTPMGGIHVSKGVDPQEVGIPIYPGAKLKEKDSDGDNKSANVNISGFGYGLKVVALQYESGDSPAKVVDYYKDHQALPHSARPLTREVRQRAGLPHHPPRSQYRHERP